MQLIVSCSGGIYILLGFLIPHVVCCSDELRKELMHPMVVQASCLVYQVGVGDPCEHTGLSNK